ncbi:GMP/IMP nucleotidase [Ectothiorhodospiraceae bacterium 2226]|nr:GMP/IMP nucleotidase [Ectothiorhodospiraceae bacterium 2226]
MLAWSEIENVLLDMDGTLLDLHFDNEFWRELVPARYAQLHGMSVEEAKAHLYPVFRAAEGTMNWYCLDYWSEQLQLDIALLKREIEHLIAVHPHTVDFLDALRAAGKRVLLVTNAHPKSLALKMERTRLEGHFDVVVSAHHYGRPKEDRRFWQGLRGDHRFDPEQTLLVDDSLPVLRSARAYGIAHLLAVLRPDSRGPVRDVAEFRAIESFADIMPTGPVTGRPGGVDPSA